MKLFLLAAGCLLSASLAAQSPVTKTYPVTAGQPIKLRFDYPIVKVSSWDKNEVSVTATVNINDHENDAAFTLSGENEAGTLVIKDEIKDMDKLPRRYTLVQNGQKTIYRSREEFDLAKKGKHEQSYEGTDINIVVEIKVPAQSAIDIKSVYGIVEMVDFHAPVVVDATYGGIDATINTSNTGKLKATTSYGQIFSNLDLKITDHTERDFFSSITAEPGKGPSYSFTSTYGKIYLRKP
ncbi:MAG: hypothetical protein QM726_11040 [Chitinophagaceae bacterium]